MTELACLQPLWDGCALLALPESEAVSVLGALRQVARCSPARALQSMRSEEQPEDHAEDDFEPPVVGEVLRQRRAEVFAAAGIKELSVPDAITVLRKRPELAGSLSDLQDAPFGALQDFMHATPLSHIGSEASQLLYATPLPTAKLASSAAAAVGAVGAAAAQAATAHE